MGKGTEFTITLPLNGLTHFLICIRVSAAVTIDSEDSSAPKEFLYKELVIVYCSIETIK